MRKIIVWAIIVSMIIVGLVACGGGGGGGGAASKNLFSLWKDTTTSAPLDLTGGNFNAPLAMFFIFTGGAQCECDLTLIGDQSSGAWALRSCGYIAGTETGDPGCNTMNSSGNYTLSSNTFGNTPGCDTYK